MSTSKSENTSTPFLQFDDNIIIMLASMYLFRQFDSNHSLSAEKDCKGAFKFLNRVALDYHTVSRNRPSSRWATGRPPPPPPLGEILDLYWIEVYPIPILN